MESESYNAEAGNAGKYVEMAQGMTFLCEVMQYAVLLYADDGIEKPGELFISFGYQNVEGVEAIYANSRSRQSYLSPNYRKDVSTTYSSLSADPSIAAQEFWEHFAYSFNVQGVPPQVKPMFSILANWGRS
jgi:hypothetical protein